MARFKSPARDFQRAAHKRFQEAKFLLDSGYFTASVYLGGYAVECSLKALILWHEPAKRHSQTLASFVGARAHDFHWLRHQLGLRKVLLPDNMREPLKKVVWWTTDLRYTAADMKETPAREFLRAAKRFLDWQEDKM